jgi:hypothetical protein
VWRKPEQGKVWAIYILMFGAWFTYYMDEGENQADGPEKIGPSGVG